MHIDFMANWPLLSILIWLPIMGAIAVLSFGKNDRYTKAIAIATTILTILFCIPLYLNFDINSYNLQFKESLNWIPSYNIYYSLGIDGISLSLILLTCYTSLVVVLAGVHSIKTRLSQYMASFLVMQGLMVGVFSATDSILFYIFWEAILIPMYLSIGIWGGTRRTYASIKFFLYTFLGSVLLLVAILFLGWHASSFEIISFYNLGFGYSTQMWLFLAFFLAFAVKIPMWPLHTWLPDAHTEAPAGGSVVLAALMLKMGIYGFIRFLLPITPVANADMAWFMIILSLIAIIYIGFIALAQTDIKKLIAYSSISHMGMASLGCFMIYPIIIATGGYQDAFMSMEGSVIHMIAHAFGSGAMFLGVGFLYNRLHTRHIGNFGGIASKMPIFAAFFMLFAMANVGLPGTAGFVGEFMVVVSAFQGSFWVSILAATTLIISAVYTLWIYARIFFNKITNDNVEQLSDISGMEWLTYVLLAAFVLIIGVYPEFILRLVHVSVAHLLTDSLQFYPIGIGGVPA